MTYVSSRFFFSIFYNLSFIFKFHAEILMRDVMNFKTYLSHFRNVGSMKFSETLYFRFMALTNENGHNFYRLGTT